MQGQSSLGYSERLSWRIHPIDIQGAFSNLLLLFSPTPYKWSIKYPLNVALTFLDFDSTSCSVCLMTSVMAMEGGQYTLVELMGK